MQSRDSPERVYITKAVRKAVLKQFEQRGDTILLMPLANPSQWYLEDN